MKVIFTDLDGTLLDHNSYSFAAAKDALALVKATSVPLVLCSSKTRGELMLYCNKLGMKLPFVSENGGGIYFPEGLLPSGLESQFCFSSKKEGYLVMEMGKGRNKLLECFGKVKSKVGVEMRSFNDMMVNEVMELTSLPENEAILAMDRSFTEPFLISSTDENIISEIISKFNEMGLTVVKGGRFYHLMGDINKGKAVKKIINIFSVICGSEIISMGLGDSENDLSMLRVVKKPVIIKKWDGSWMGAKGTENFARTEGIGPAGWNDAVLAFLGEKVVSGS